MQLDISKKELQKKNSSLPPKNNSLSQKNSKKSLENFYTFQGKRMSNVFNDIHQEIEKRKSSEDINRNPVTIKVQLQKNMEEHSSYLKDILKEIDYFDYKESQSGVSFTMNYPEMGKFKIIFFYKKYLKFFLKYK